MIEITAGVPETQLNAGSPPAGAAPSRPGRSRERLAVVRRSTLVAMLALAFVAGGVAGGIAGRLWPNEKTVILQTAPVAEPQLQVPVAPDIATIVAGITPSVVGIEVTTTHVAGTRTVTGQEVGTGFVFREDGVIATNAHVIEGGTNPLVTLTGGAKLAATVIGLDSARDLALIKIESQLLPAAPLGTSAPVKAGDTVLVIGNAMGLPGGPTTSKGIVSALDRSITTGQLSYSHLIQTDAPMNKGNSGGPLVDANGRVIGINTISTSTGQSVGFAIGIDEALPVLNQLLGAQP